VFNLAQTFLVDASAVKGATQVSITKVDLFFRTKPKETGNKSGIVGPGVEVTIAPCIFGIPVIPDIEVAGDYVTSRKAWSEITPSADASSATSFQFAFPAVVATGFEYAILVKYDGDEDFILWSSHQGDKLVGTTTISPGPSGKYVGNYYTYISPLASGTSTNAAANAIAATANNSALLQTTTNPGPGQTIADYSYLVNAWKPLKDTDLKFKVYVARYSHNGIPLLANTSFTQNGAANGVLGSELVPTLLSNNIVQFPSPSLTKEYVVFDTKLSNFNDLRWGMCAFQNTVSYPGGSATPLTVSVGFNTFSVNANGSFLYSNGTTFAAAGGFNNLYTGTGNEYIVIKSGNSVSVRVVTGIVSNTCITIDQPCDFTNTAAYFIKSPVGQIVNMQRAYTFGKSENILIIDNTNANTDCRFVNNCIESVTISANGSGYSNSDYVVFSGFENVTAEVQGGYSATANIVTDGNGAITAVYLSNIGCGFVNTSWITGANVVINNSSAQPSSGTTANLIANVGTTILVDKCPNTYFKGCRIVNLQTNHITPTLGLSVPLGSNFTTTHRTLFYTIDSANTFSGKAYYVNATPSATDASVKNYLPHYFDANARPILASRSNEFIIRYANNGVANTSIIGRTFSNGAVYLFNVSSNSDYMSPLAATGPILASYGKYIINNDYTNEHTNYGNAYAKHVTTKVNFNNDRFAEDNLLYLTAYRPLGTDLKAYVRIHNSNDPEAFDDKDWTMLEQIDGIDVYSSTDDPSDFVELTYNFQAYPNNTILTGTVNVASISVTNVSGANTTFDVDLAANDLVLIYQPLFPNNYVVSVVNNVVNSTLISIRKPVANNGLVGPGLAIAKINYPHQAFNNQLNSNVVRYYSTSIVEYDTYDTFQIKIIFLSNNDYIVPKFDDVRGLGVTA
jgi:hypothetical protein